MAPMTVIRGISSMATRQLLAELCAMYGKVADVGAAIESVGGVDAAKRVQAGEAFDVVFLAADAIDKLEAAHKVVAGSRVEIVKSGVSVAVKAGSPVPEVSTEVALKQTVLAAASIGYSTGPSGTALLRLFERWNIGGELQGRLVQAPPGVPVGSLVAGGRVALGFQQLSELIHLPGITIAGPMPHPVEIITTFCGAICETCTQREAARDLLAFMASPQAADAKRRLGMETA
jgi:molybdate transport system substrate-binding protein